MSPFFGAAHGVARPFVILLFVALCSTSAAAQLDLSGYDLRPFYENDFSRPQKIVSEEDLIEQAGAVWRRKARPARDAEWIAEGWGGAEIRDGRLFVAPSPFESSGRPRPVEPGRRS
ncbi:MAG TPA: hypothetical protein VI479_16700, partial [Blastocatellia bacterium]